MSLTIAPGSVEVLVRIKPLNPKKGRVKQRYATFFGTTFYESRGWNRVPSKIVHGERTFDVANYLRNVLQNESDPDSENVFDVCTKEEARALDKKEKKAREEKNTADTADLIGGVNNPVDMTLSVGPDAEEEAPTEVPAPAPSTRKPRAPRATASTAE